MARVTVLMAVYNAKNTIEECIESILNQTFQDFKILIVNDLSDDNTVELIENFKSDKIEIINFETKGYINALNTGLSRCSNSEYIARMDADDIMYPSRLEEQVKFMDAHPEVAASGSYIEVFGKYSAIWKRFSPKYEQCRRNIFWFSTIQNPSSIIRNSIIKENGLKYKREYAFIDGAKDYALAEDYKFWYDISRIGILTNIPKVLLKYRIHTTQASSAKKGVQDIVAKKIRREAVINFINDYGLNIRVIDGLTDKKELLKKIDKLIVSKKDRWHLAMTKFMIIQSSKEIGFGSFLKVLFTTNFIFDRNSAELFWKMVRTKAGANEKPMI